MSSSPFELVRRNLKPLMVLLTLLAIFSFVVLPSLEVYMRHNVDLGGEATTLATYDGGQYDITKVSYFTRSHFATVQFLQQLAEITIARGGTPRVSGFQYDAEQNQIRNLGINSNPNDQASVRTLMFAAKAKEADLQLDDTAIRSWLTAYTDGRLSDAEINGVLQSATRNRLGQFHLYEQLRTQLLSEAFQRSVMAGLAVEGRPIVPPAQQWDLFLRLNRRAVADAYAVNVAEFISQTAEQPANTEIQRVYEDGKTRFPDDQSPLPAFRRPYVANLQYLAGSLEDFIAREVEGLSEEQLRAEYQRRLEGGDFKMPATPEPPAAPESPAAAEQPAADTPTPAAEAEAPAETPAPAAAAEDTPAAADAAMTPAEAAQPAAPVEQPAPAAEPEPAPASEPAPAAEPEPAPPNEPAPAAGAEPQPAAPESPAAEPASETPAEADAPAENSDAPAAGDDAAEPAATDSSRLPSASDRAVALVALRAQEEDQEDAAPADDAAPAAAAEAPAAETPATETPAAEVADAAAEPPAEAAPAAEAASSAEPAPQQTQPFEQVRDEIARSLAMPPAMEKLNEAMGEAERVMRTYFNNLAIAGPHADKRPERPNLQELADRLGLTYGETGLIDAGDLSDEPIARSFTLGDGMQRGNSFLQTMFIDRPALLTPVRTIDDQTAISYVSWKTEERDAVTPSLEEARDEVILAIRTAQARELAKAHAEKLAKDFNATQQPVRELIDESQHSQLFESLGPFSWMNSFGFGMQAFMGNIPELDQVGEDFMRQVFTSQRDHWGVAPNAPQSVFYVVRPVEFSPSTDELHQRFSQLIQRFQASTLAVEEVIKVRDGFYEALDKRSGFQWNEAALEQ